MVWRGFLLCGIGLFLMMVPCRSMAADIALRDIGDGILQEDNGRMWQAARSKRFRTVDEAEQYLANLNSGRFNDWRFPTRQELYELFMLFDLKESGDISIRLEGAYWLTGRHGEPKIGSWEIGDQCGPARTYYPGLSGYVRAVRP